MDNGKPLHCIIYISKGAIKFTAEILLDILRESRSRNEAHDITGVLLYNEGNIMQLIEGYTGEIQSLFNRIKKDRRHNDIIKLVDRPVGNRTFSGWSMAFRQGDEQFFNKMKSYINPVKKNMLAQVDNEDDSVLFILKTFIALNPQLTNIGLDVLNLESKV